MSIASLSCSTLPNFAVLTGRNGAGKTQLLRAISGGSAAVTGISSDDIEFYDMDSFRPSDNTPGNRNHNQFARMTARDYMHGNEGPPPVKIALELFERHTADLERKKDKGAAIDFVNDLRQRIETTPDFGAFPISRKTVFEYDLEFQNRVMAPLVRLARSRTGSHQSTRNSFRGNPAALVTRAMKSSHKLPHELTYDDIIRASYYEGGTIENIVSQVFAAYKVDQYEWAHTHFETASGLVSRAEVVGEYQERNPPPWDTLREVMATMRDAAGEDGLFDFDFSDPAGIRLNMENYQQFSFQTEMTNRTSGARYEPKSLSSGEKILMALCLGSFNQLLGRRRPKLVLLDELDVLLHPSMVTALITALKSLFLDHGSQVIMATHSPMTVAALPENSVYRLIRNGSDVQLSPATKAEAVEELSEGIATVDAGLRIAASDEAEVIILTEGHNARHLKRWVELNFPEGVHVFDKLAQHTSKGQLLAYGRMLAAMDPVSNFVIVWDCDAAKQAQTLRQELPSGAKVTPFAFTRRENKIIKSGIENNYDEELLSPYTISRRDNQDGRVLPPVFNSARKTEFADHVCHHGTSAYFTHFEDLHKVIAGIFASFEKPIMAKS